ncbi:MAG TPA: hypothetical protein IAB06_01810 [Candidatus Avacidaminococcus intestinavium]|uniref:Peptidase S55 domain-containing protein n=1 Tax=Candidatus Avacidaminococcus intestinavium TaxID=2840684 RepID=A0A9D1MPI2_9FIRM|nr:hypothetical protein [Candidatus Avacidaminococcus intestinavium]
MFFTGVASAEPTPIITVNELKTGMHGIAKTVIKGATIETFDVEILGVTGSESEGHSILIKASGPLIERSGGIAQGMSGSPVYINGRLAGAVAYGKAFSDPNYCFLTPIEEMLKMFEPNDPRPSYFLPKNTSLMVSGFSKAGLEYLSKKLSPFDLQPLAVPTGQKEELNNVTLEPGSSIGVELVRGDMRLGAIGTVTWMDEAGRILAFGHPFMKRGATDYFMTNAWIFASIPNVESSYKVGALGKSVGKITQDRSAGIAGQLGETPKIIPLFISVTDIDRGLHKTAAVQFVTDEALVPPLVDAICYNSVETAIDRAGGGTARVSFRITARGEKSGELTVTRENMFYNPGDLAKAINGEIVYATDMLMRNKFEKTTIFDINVDIEASSECGVSEITSVRAQNAVVKPGDKVAIDVDFLPYRGTKITKTFTFTVPKKQRSGKMSLIVRGGSSSAWLSAVLQNQQAGAVEEIMPEKKNLTDFIAGFNEFDANNELIIDVLPPGMSGAQPVDEEENPLLAMRTLFKGTNAKKTYPMDFIINGEAEITLTVEDN